MSYAISLSIWAVFFLILFYLPEMPSEAQEILPKLFKYGLGCVFFQSLANQIKQAIKDCQRE